jgi:hypothetical protein
VVARIVVVLLPGQGSGEFQINGEGDMRNRILLSAEAVDLGFNVATMLGMGDPGFKPLGIRGMSDNK